MVEIQEGQHVILEGINGSGKTWCARNGILPLWDRDLVIDTEGMEFEDFPTVDVKQALKLIRSKYSFYAKLSFTGDLETDLPRLDELCRGIRAIKATKNPIYPDPFSVYFDEFTDFADATMIPPSLRSLIRTLRKRHGSIIAGTQRPQLMNKTMVANAVHRFYFFMSDYDAEQVRSYAPFVRENLSRIPYQSYKCLYQRPDSSVVILSPFPEYPWERRLNRAHAP
jgi:hypothetical protein